MTYVVTGKPGRLDFVMGHGDVRRVRFVDHEAEHAALETGRSQLDRVAIERGLLPYGSIFVSVPGKTFTNPASLMPGGATSRTLQGSALGFRDGAAAIHDGSITPDVDAMARIAHPEASRRYDGLVSALQARRGSPMHLAYALLLDALRRPAVVPEGGAIRTGCGMHPDPAMGLYVYGGATSFNCFSCGAGGGEEDWLVLRHGLSRTRASDILLGRG
jgi:hypothetical protein